METCHCFTIMSVVGLDQFILKDLLILAVCAQP